MIPPLILALIALRLCQNPATDGWARRSLRI
jgi:hypothetical protein